MNYESLMRAQEVLLAKHHNQHNANYHMIDEEIVRAYSIVLMLLMPRACFPGTTRAEATRTREAAAAA